MVPLSKMVRVIQVPLAIRRHWMVARRLKPKQWLELPPFSGHTASTEKGVH